MDVSKHNGIDCINDPSLIDELKVAAISGLLPTDNHCDAQVQILRSIYALFTRDFPVHKLWCIVGDSLWQSDTRVIRHKKLCARLKARGVEISHMAIITEKAVQLDGKLKYFGLHSSRNWLSSRW